MWLESDIAVAVAQAGSCSSDLTPSPGTSICCKCGDKKKKKKISSIILLAYFVCFALLWFMFVYLKVELRSSRRGAVVNESD